MRDLAILFIHLLTAIAKLMRPGGGRAVVAESLLLKHQLVVLNRGHCRDQETQSELGLPPNCTTTLEPLGARRHGSLHTSNYRFHRW